MTRVLANYTPTATAFGHALTQIETHAELAAIQECLYEYTIVGGGLFLFKVTANTVVRDGEVVS